MSPVIGPPDHCCFDLSLRVRSGLIAVQVAPRSVVRNSTFAPWYSTFGSCGESAIGALHWKRYFASLAGVADGSRGYTRTRRWLRTPPLSPFRGVQAGPLAVPQSCPVPPT